MKPRHTRVTLRDQMIANQKALDIYAMIANKPPVDIGVPDAPKRRAPPTQPRTVPLESEIQHQIIDGLRMHPMVGMVERVNSGNAAEVNADGSMRFVSFGHIYQVPGKPKMRRVDVSVTLKGPGEWAGKRLVIECKRPGWKRPAGEREIEQEAYIEHVMECGGYGLFATGWDEVEEELRWIATQLRPAT